MFKDNTMTIWTVVSVMRTVIAMIGTYGKRNWRIYECNRNGYGNASWMLVL